MESALERIEQHLDMFLGFDLSEDCAEGTVGMNDKGGAFGAHVGFSVHLFLHPDLIGFDE